MQSITSFSSCIHAFHDLDLYNNVLIPCAWNEKTCFLSWITICMIYHRSCIDSRFEKHKYLDIITWVSIFMHHTSSTIVSSEGVDLQKPLLGISQIKDHLQRPIYPLSPVSYWPPSPVPYWPIKPISLGPLSLSRDPLLRNGQLLCSPFGQRPSP